MLLFIDCSFLTNKYSSIYLKDSRTSLKRKARCKTMDIGISSHVYAYIYVHPCLYVFIGISYLLEKNMKQ